MPPTRRSSRLNNADLIRKHLTPRAAQSMPQISFNDLPGASQGHIYAYYTL